MNLFKTLLLAGFLCGCGESTAVTEKNQVVDDLPSSEEMTEADVKCRQFIRSYVQSKKGWKDDQYRIVREQLPSDVRGFSVQHVDDDGPLPKGGLKSFHVNLDKSCGTVIDELGYQ